jgi:hypothetical protein
MGPKVVRRLLWGSESPEAHGAPGVAEPTAQPRPRDLLPLYNHLAADQAPSEPKRNPGGETWIVLPCAFRTGDGGLVSGSVRLLFDPVSRAIRTLVVGASRDGGPQWWFRILPGPEGVACQAYADPGARTDTPQVLALRGLLDKMGVRLADTIGDGSLFDGFTPATDEPAPVDLLG